MSEQPMDDVPGALTLDISSLALGFTSLAVFGVGSESEQPWFFGLSIVLMAVATTLKLVSTRRRQRAGAAQENADRGGRR
ncbi:MAG TPA: hypothetical protein VNP72_01470 [Longimicrobium sp.]|nr:hypothetical protein [Longimicrobium sp.]